MSGAAINMPRETPPSLDVEWMLYLADCCLRSSAEAFERSDSWWVRLTGQREAWREHGRYWHNQERNWRQVAQDVNRRREPAG